MTFTLSSSDFEKYLVNILHICIALDFDSKV